jgi:hypothetical protein
MIWAETKSTERSCGLLRIRLQIALERDRLKIRGVFPPLPRLAQFSRFFFVTLRVSLHG